MYFYASDLLTPSSYKYQASGSLSTLALRSARYRAGNILASTTRMVYSRCWSVIRLKQIVSEPGNSLPKQFIICSAVIPPEHTLFWASKKESLTLLGSFGK